MIHSEAIPSIHQQVASMYERFPYPAYPLFARLQWWQAYLSPAAFAWALCHPSRSRRLPRRANILVAGCGDTQPYIHRKLEPAHHSIMACDLSRRHIQRARSRLLIEPKRVSWQVGDLLNLSPSEHKFDHIDCYGVIHHMVQPLEGLKHISALLKPGATLRLMVYHSDSRDWIWQLRQIFQLLGLSYQNQGDLSLARQLIIRISDYHEGLRENLAGVNIRTISNTHLVDRFFHVQEARLSISDWWTAFERLGLTLHAIFDRYAELDDLPNPLWQPPRINEIALRARDHRFENNLECYLSLAGTSYQNGQHSTPTVWQRHWQKMHAPPSLWYDFEETASLSRRHVWNLWSAHLDYLYQAQKAPIERVLDRLEPRSVQRLARLGAILPGQIQDNSWHQLAIGPLEASLPSYTARPANWESPDLITWLETIVKSRGCSKNVTSLIKSHLKQIKIWSQEASKESD